MTNRRGTAMVLLIFALGIAGCDRSDSPVPLAPSTVVPTPQPLLSDRLVVFTEPTSGFSTSDVRDVHEQIVQFSGARELIWTADGTRLPGYTVQTHTLSEGPVSFVTGKICPQDCAFEVRFGTRDGERRAYLTIDDGHDNPGTVVDLEVVGGVLVVAETDVFAPGTYTLSGVVSELTDAGAVPLEGASVYRGVSTGWRRATTDRNGFYSMRGMYDSTHAITAHKPGYQTAERNSVPLKGDTRVDFQLVPQ